MSRIQRIKNEMTDLFKNPLDNDNIFYELDNDNIEILKVMMIGTENTPYEYGYYLFDIKIPENYPFSPPKIKYCTQNNR